MGEGSTRDRILTAGEALFAEVGFEGATLRRLTTTAEVNLAAVHYHFGNKEALWREAVEPGLIGLRDAVADVIEHADPGDAAGTLETFLRRLVSTAAANPHLTRILSREAIEPSPRLLTMVFEHGVPFLASFAELYERAVEDGTVRAMPAEQALLICAGAAESYLRVAALGEILAGDGEVPQVDVDEYADHVVEVCFCGLRPR